MRLKTILSPTVTRALEQVNQELGPHALILETEQEGEWTRVVAADVEREEPAEGLMRLRAEIALLRRELAQQNEVLRALVSRARPADAPRDAEPTPAAAPPRAAAAVPAATAAPAPAATTPPPIAATAPASAAPAAPVVRNAAPRSSVVRPRFALLERRLREQGVRGDLIERFLDMCADAPESEGDPLLPGKSEWCATALAGLIPGIGPSGNRRARCYVFAGPPGAGKSTSIAKLLQQSRPADQAGIALITLDDRQPGNVLLLRTAQRLRIRHAFARGAEELVRLIKELDEPKSILVDTGGFGARERRALAALRERMPQAGQVATHLVLRGDADDAATLAAARPFADASPAALLFTRLDLAPRLGGLINVPAALGLPIAALGHGTALAGDLTVPHRRQVAELVLGRRLLRRR